MSKNKINIAVIGATGFTGLDLVFLLSKHPKVRINYLCATKNLGKNISNIDNRIKKKLPKITSAKTIDWKKIDLVFLSLPNGEAQKLIKKVYQKFNKIKFIDLSADFRLVNHKKYKENYKKVHKAKKLIKSSIYSISEFVKKEIVNFRIIANPGCYPTSIQLPLVPLLKKKLIKNSITIDSKSGYSGAGKGLEKKFKHKNLYSSVFAYSTKNHRHIAEIDQEFNKMLGKQIKFSFNPHLIPTFRGILSAIYVEMNNKVSIKKIRNELLQFYKKDKFIRILNLNSNIGTGNVLNTNNCEISICETRIRKKIIIFSAIDNLIKGASGQAIQNMNLLYRFPEGSGLK
tara:strand:- start:4482 stop:5513 length:1032 start_codon:yes stop_codon:yes gene_type:complete